MSVIQKEISNTPEGKAIRSAIATKRWANFIVENSVYPNLTSELFRQQVSVNKLAEILNMVQETVSKKIRGKRNFQLAQMEMIRNFLQVETSLEELFRRVE